MVSPINCRITISLTLIALRADRTHSTCDLQLVIQRTPLRMCVQSILRGLLQQSTVGLPALNRIVKVDRLLGVGHGDERVLGWDVADGFTRVPYLTDNVIYASIDAPCRLSEVVERFVDF